MRVLKDRRKWEEDQKYAGEEICVAHYASPVGSLRLTAKGEYLTGVDTQEGIPETVREDLPPVLRDTMDQLDQYFRGELREFHLPLSFHGTPFQEKVWQTLTTIPFGETRSYGEIARQVGSPGGSRAVGGANHKNPLMIVIPCHRVIGADGSLTGFGGGLPVKKYLLELEQEVLRRTQ